MDSAWGSARGPQKELTGSTRLSGVPKPKLTTMGEFRLIDPL